MSTNQGDVARTTLAVLALGALIAATFWVLRPFLAAALWAIMIVVATWPVFVFFRRRLWNRRWLASGLMAIILLLVFVLPCSVVIGQLVRNAPEIASAAKGLGSLQVPPAPGWVTDVPLIGEAVAHTWSEMAQSGLSDLSSELTPYTGAAARWLATQLGGIGNLLVQFLITLALASVLYAHGEVAARFARRTGLRLAGPHGEQAVALAGQAIRGVALGIVLTALVQAFIGGIGLAIVGTPLSSVLTAVLFFLCVAQVGPLPVLLPVILWLFWSGQTGWGIFLLVWAIPVSTLDAVMRSVLIQRGAHLPLLLVFAGVIGGLLSFGLVGLFVGPVVLAIAYTLLGAWLESPATGA
jgi:predicted PurR-regulated permease PerM